MSSSNIEIFVDSTGFQGVIRSVLDMCMRHSSGNVNYASGWTSLEFQREVWAGVTVSI